MQMLFSYITVLLERAETAFQDKETLPDTVLKLPQSLKDALLDLNERLEKETFEKQTFDCGICLDPKKGTQCYRIRHCGHVFCIKCLQDYYNDAIKEGAVQNITCLDPTCGKTGNPAIDRTLKPRKLTPKELLRIPLDLEMVTRYVEIKRKKLIESDPSIVFCPREWCQGAMRTAKYPKPGDITQMDDPEAYEFDAPAAPREKTEDEIAEENRMFGAPHTDRLAVCEDCNLAFCKVCLRSWHGDLVRCANRNKKQISPEEQASLDFILGATTPCPQCEARCQKSHGCNHMQCFNCDAHFCYICAAWLDPRNPYDHFNFKRNEQCYGKLFQGVEGNDDEIEFAGARAAEIQAAVFDQEAARIQDEVIQEQLDQEEG
jgi:E3 ubiquitin-protein ligase RNF14